MNRILTCLMCVAVLSGCQTYDFERVTPLAVGQRTDKKIFASRSLKPNIMLLLDNSASMLEPTDPSCSGTGCSTRIQELQASMNGFLSQNPTLARFGAAKYPLGPGADQCKPTVDVNATGYSVPLPAPTVNDDGTDAALIANANQVNALIQSLKPAGGTPTGASLAFLGTYAALNDRTDFRDDFVLLLTDGLPNCNASNANNVCNDMSAEQKARCACVSGQNGSGCVNSLCALGCLDQDDTVSAVRRLLQQDIKTIVVGFGADTASGPGPAVLQAIAEAGGFPRECRMGTNDECGAGNTCDPVTRRCAKAFYQAANGAELTEALLRIRDAIDGPPCIFSLKEAPSDARYLSVLVDGQTTPPGPDTYVFDPGRN